MCGYGLYGLSIRFRYRNDFKFLFKHNTTQYNTESHNSYQNICKCVCVCVCVRVWMFYPRTNQFIATIYSRHCLHCKGIFIVFLSLIYVVVTYV